MITLTDSDKKKLLQAHPDLVKVVNEYLKSGTIPIKIMEVGRSLVQQKANIAKGVSWTMRSRHLVSSDGLARAVDIVPLVDGKITWSWPVYYKLAPQMKAAAKSVKIPVEWGGDWKSNKDGPHWQLPWKQYP